MEIHDAMSRNVKTVSHDEPIERAADLMRECDCGALVVHKDGRLVGVVTDRDIVVRGVAQGKSSQTCLVSEVMTPGIKYIFDDESAELAVESMSLFQIRRLPVVNHDKKLVGIITLGDLAIRHNAPAAGLALKGISRPGSNLRSPGAGGPSHGQ